MPEGLEKIMTHQELSDIAGIPIQPAVRAWEQQFGTATGGLRPPLARFVH